MTLVSSRANWSWLQWWTLPRLLLLGFATRLLWLLLCQNEPTSDQVVYLQAARSMAGGDGFVDELGRPHGWWPVGYPAALTPFFWLLGPAVRSGYVANLVFGLVLIAGIHALARELFGETAGRLAAFVGAVQPTFVLLTTILASENLFVAIAAWGSWALVRAVHRPRHALAYCALGGVLIGLSAYVRAPGLLLSAVFPVLALLSKWKWSRVVPLSALIGGLAIATLVPWGIRTQHAFGTFQLVSMNGASNLWMGNNPESNGGYMPLPERVRGMGIVKREEFLRAEAVDFIKNHPGAYAQRCMRRIWMTLRSDTIASVWNETGISAWGGRVGVVAFKLICSGAYFALWLALLLSLYVRRGHWSRYDTLMLGTLVASGFTFVVIVGGNRYHLPMAPYLWVWLSGWARAPAASSRSAVATS